MSIHFNTNEYMNESMFGSSGVNVSEVVNASYTSMGAQVINGSTFTVVKFIDILSFGNTTGSPSALNENGTIYFNQTWNATLITIMGYSITGSLASQLGSELLIYFELPFVFTALQSSLNIGTAGHA